MTRRPQLALVVATLLVALLGACGITADDGPQPIAANEIPPDLVDPNSGSSTTRSGTGGTTVQVYLLDETPEGVHLVAVDRRVDRADLPDDRLAALFGGATDDEIDAGITTSIPADTVLLGVSASEDDDDDEVMVDISEDIFSVQSGALAQAFAQIVYTVTEPDAGGFRQVRFSREGEPVPALDGEGVEQEGPVTRADYDSLAPLP